MKPAVDAARVSAGKKQQADDGKNEPKGQKNTNQNIDTATPY